MKKYFIDLGIIEEYTKTQEEKERDRMQGLGRMLIALHEVQTCRVCSQSHLEEQE